jgi:hypothetical protein
MKVVVNRCYGGFNVSREAFLRMRELGSKEALQEPDIGEMYSDGSGPRQIEHWTLYNLRRNDPILVQVVEELKEKASGSSADLQIVEIPDGMDFIIEEYDGSEWVSEKHRTW